MNNTRKLVEGAILAAVYLVILLTAVYSPIIGGFTVFLLPLPITLYFARNDVKMGIVVLITTSVLAVIVGSPLYALVTVFVSNAAGAVLGYMIRKKIPMSRQVIVLTVVYAIEFYISFKFSEFLMGYNYLDMINEEMQMLITMVQENAVTSMFVTEESIDYLVQQLDLVSYFFEHFLWLIVVFAALMNTYITLTFVQILFKKLNIPFEKGKPFIYWRFPKWVAYAYLATMPFVLFQDRIPFDLTNIIYSVNTIFNVIFVVQGLAVVLFFAAVKKWSPIIRLLIVLSVFMGFGSLYMFVGVFDIISNLRPMIIEMDRVKREEKNNQEK